MTDTQRIGEVAAQLMADIDQHHPNAEIGEVAIVVEVKYEDSTHFETNSSTPRGWITRALFENAIRSVKLRMRG